MSKQRAKRAVKPAIPQVSDYPTITFRPTAANNAFLIPLTQKRGLRTEVLNRALAEFRESAKGKRTIGVLIA